MILSNIPLSRTLLKLLICCEMLWATTGQARTSSSQVIDRPELVSPLGRIQVHRVWIQHNTHRHGVWWDRGTPWEGKPALTVHSHITATNLQGQEMEVDVEFHALDRKLISFAAGAPPHCSGNDGALRPSWRDKLTTQFADYKAFRISVPYSAFVWPGGSEKSCIVSVRAYCCGLSSRYEAILNLSQNVQPTSIIQPDVTFGRTEFNPGQINLPTNHNHAGGMSWQPPGEHTTQFEIIQWLKFKDAVPDDLRTFIQISKPIYRAQRPFVEDYVLNRKHYLPLSVAREQKPQLAHEFGRPNQDYLATEALLQEIPELPKQRKAAVFFAEERLRSFLPSGRQEKLVLTSHLSCQGRSIYFQQEIRSY